MQFQAEAQVSESSLVGSTSLGKGKGKVAPSHSWQRGCPLWVSLWGAQIWGSSCACSPCTFPATPAPGGAQIPAALTVLLSLQGSRGRGGSGRDPDHLER